MTLALFFDTDMKFETKKGLGYVVVMFVAVSITKNLCIIVRQAYLDVKKKRRESRERENAQA